MNSNINQQLMVLAVLIVITVFFVYSRSFKDDVPDCNGYVTNVYLYVLLGLLLTCFSVLFIAKRRYPITTTKSLMAFGIALIALFSMYAIDPRNALLNHAAWLVFLIAISVSVYSIWRYSQYKGVFTSSMIITIILVAGLTAVATWRPDLISLGWGAGLTIALLAGILAWIVPLIFDIGGGSAYYRLLSAFFVVVFMMLILYDTKLLRVKAQQCTVPDYPTDSLGLFLDIINLFANISRLQ